MWFEGKRPENSPAVSRSSETRALKGPERMNKGRVKGTLKGTLAVDKWMMTNENLLDCCLLLNPHSVYRELFKMQIFR